MKKLLVGLLVFMVLSALVLSGCGGGSGGGGSVGYSGGGGSTANPSTSGSTTTFTGTKGYVYTVSSGKAASSQIIVLPTNSSVPSGFTPAVGYTVRSATNSLISTITDAKGYFDLSTSSETAVSQDGEGVVVEDPATGTSTSPICFPIMRDPMALSELTDVRIVPPFDTTQNSWSLIASAYEMFFLIGRSGDTWHPVSDSVTWSVSDENLGSFVENYGLFKSSTDLSTTTTGTVKATCSDSTFSLSLKVVAISDLGSIEGTVKDESGNAVPWVMVSAVPSSTATSTVDKSSRSQHFHQFPYYSRFMAMTDKDGAYTISYVPPDTYTVKVSSYYGSGLAEDTVTVAAGKNHKDFTVSSVSAYITGVVNYDKYAYKPGDTMKVQVVLWNKGGSSVDINYTKVDFALKYCARPAKTSTTSTTVPEPVTVAAASDTTGGTATVPKYGKTLIPTSTVSLAIPSDQATDGYFYLEGTVTTTPSIKVEPWYVKITSSGPSPTPSPTATVSPSPSPTASASPSPSPSSTASKAPSRKG
ncbi:MAG: carboxypeptidase-like regulatory domain-containing protein [Candidatus Eremiobacteraeota bacterium]|nr:carboxypeptidase-like regulatory domain-containing protein [Candidatus Eremiobacteraeota bacterium]